IPPAKDRDTASSLLQIAKEGAHKVVHGWGLGGVKRILKEYLPITGEAREKAFANRGLKVEDAWHLLAVAADPAHEGHSYVSMMMRERFRKTAPTPVYLESSSPKSRNVYLHYGFE
ncbi:hypothetical protein K488DRAFT_13215, partial [Vararia minispora EC-137]